MMTANASINSKKKSLFMPQFKEVDKKVIERKDREKISISLDTHSRKMLKSKKSILSKFLMNHFKLNYLVEQV
jgi:hypothetical protein